MIFKVFLLSVAAVAGYQGQLLFRRGGPRRRSFALMLLVDALGAILAFASLHEPEAAAQAPLIGAIALGAFVFLVLVPPRLRQLARWATRRDHLRLALRLLDAHELLQPGMGARDEREALSAFAELREGKTERAIEALRAARAQASDPLHRRQIDERIVFAYLTARRWRSAVEHFERAIDAQPGPVSANVLVEVLRAYGELGERDKAADLITRIEDSPLPGEPQLQPLVARARMVFLAFAGRAAAVEAMVAARGPLGMMAPSARAYWIGVARREAGDAQGAREALSAAVRASAGDLRQRSIAAEELAALEQAPSPPPPPPLSDQIARVADRVGERAALAPTPAAQGAPVPKLEGVSWKQVPVTSALIVANVIVAVLVYALLGSSMDPAVMIRAGANLPMVTTSGEWWRLLSSTFLHWGVLHLAVNMYGLWVLGRLVEQIHGPRRYLVTYVLAGLGGSLASVYFGPGAPSAGASGAVFGILGAAIAEFALRRRAYPEAWRRAVLGNLLFLAVANVLIGSAVPGIDQAAHLGGLVTGALAGAVLAPRGRFGRTRAARAVAATLAVVALFAVAGSAVAVVTTKTVTSVERVGWVPVAFDGSDWTLEAPRLWLAARMTNAAVIHAPDSNGKLVLEGLDEMVKENAVTGARSVPARFTTSGWTGEERLGALSTSGTRLEVRVASYVRGSGKDDDGRLRVTFALPERDVAAVLPVVRRVLSSARPPG